MELHAEVKKQENKSQEQRIFELECQVSMLHEFVVQLVGELKKNGLSISDKLNDDFDDELYDL